MDADVAIVGGGVVGLTAASALGHAGYRCALISPSVDVPELGPEFDTRTYALTPATLNVFDRLGVGALFDESRIAQIRQMRVWDANSKGQLSFTPELLGRSALGVIVEHANIYRALSARLSTSGCVVINGLVSDIENDLREARVRLQDGASVTARLVVCADGAASPTRKALGIETAEHDYQQRAIVCNVRTTEPHNFIARQIFLNDGPLAFLPMAEGHTNSIVWSLSNDEAERMLALNDRQFELQLAAAFENTLGSVTLMSERLAFPLKRLHSAAYVKARAVLVGDSAHVVHPLAGQGLNLGIMDVAALTEALGPAARESLTDPTRCLRRFERWRRADNQLMMTTTNQLNALFRVQAGPLSWLRGAGLNLTDRFMPLKRLLTGHAIGIAGEIPALARPL